MTATLRPQGAPAPVTAICPSCQAPQDQGLLCANCTLRLEHELGDVPAIVAELDVTLAKQSRMENGGKGGLAHERSPMHTNASLAADYLTNALTTWARDVGGPAWDSPTEAFVTRKQRAPAGPYCLICPHRSCGEIRDLRIVERPPVITAAHLLLREINAIRKHGAVEELVDEVCSAIDQARKTSDRTVNRIRFFVGPCFEMDEDGEHCPGEVWAFIPTEDARPPRMECRANSDHRWTSSQFYRAGKRIHDRAEHISRQALGAA